MTDDHVRSRLPGRRPGAPGRGPDASPGEGTYIDNLEIPGVLHLSFVRSPIAHAEITEHRHHRRACDARRRRGVHRRRSRLPRPRRDDAAAPGRGPARRSRGKVRFVGDTVAVVVAETKAQAVDAAEAVDRRLRPAARGGRPWRPRSRRRAAAVRGARHQHRDRRPRRPTATTRSRAPTSSCAGASRTSASRSCRWRARRSRWCPATTAPATSSPCTSAARCRTRSAAALAGSFGLEPSAVRVIAPHVGGAFGGKPGAAGARRRGAARARARPAGEVGRDPLREHDRDAARPRPGAVRRARAASATARSSGCGADRRRRRRVRRVRRRARVRADPHDGAGRLPDPEDRLRRRGRRHQHDADGRVPGAGRPEAAAMLERIIDIAAASSAWTRSRCGAATSSQPDEFPYTTVTGRTYDSRRLRRARSTRRCASPATTSCGPSSRPTARARRRAAARHRHVARTSRSPRAGGAASTRAVEVHDDGTATIRRARRRTGRATPPRRADRRRAARHPDRAHPLRAVRHRARPAGRRHRRLAVAAARRERGRWRGVAAVLERARSARGRPARGRRRRHRADATTARLGVAGVPRKSVTWAELADRRPPTRRRRSSPSSTSSRSGRIVPVRCARRGRRGRPRDRPRRRRCATSPSTTAAASSTRCSSTASVHGGHRAGHRAGAVGGDASTTTTATRSRRPSPTTAIPSAAEFPRVRGAQHRDAVAAQPARREGDRRVGHDRLARRRCRTRSSTRSATSASATSTCRCTPERVWRAIEAPSAGTLPDPWREPPAVFATLALRQQAAPSKDEEIDL